MKLLTFLSRFERGRSGFTDSRTLHRGRSPRTCESRICRLFAINCKGGTWAHPPNRTFQYGEKNAAAGAIAAAVLGTRARPTAPTGAGANADSSGRALLQDARTMPLLRRAPHDGLDEAHHGLGAAARVGSSVGAACHEGAVTQRVGLGPARGRPVFRLRQSLRSHLAGAAARVERAGLLCAQLDGFDLHGRVAPTPSCAPKSCASPGPSLCPPHPSPKP